MHFGVQGLDPAVQHLREAGVVGHFGDRHAGVSEHLAVPPVERISTPNWRRALAKSSTPVLSETLMRACLIGHVII